MKYKKIIAIITVVIIILILIGLYIAGFRIIYNPKLITDWDAVSGCADWVGAIASVMAIWYAIQVPKKIADRQNKIALFEKCFECYMMVQDILMYAKAIENTDNIKKIQAYYILTTQHKGNPSDNVTLITVSSDIGNAEKIIMSGGFLFKQFDVNLMQKAIGAIGPVLTSIFPISTVQEKRLPEDKNILKNEFCSICRDFENKYLDLMEKELDIRNR